MYRDESGSVDACGVFRIVFDSEFSADTDSSHVRLPRVWTFRREGVGGDLGAKEGCRVEERRLPGIRLPYQPNSDQGLPDRILPDVILLVDGERDVFQPKRI